MPAKPKPKSKAGRPPTPIDYDQVQRLAQIQCTEYEIAALIDMSDDGFRRRKLSDNELVGALKKGYENGKASLRRLQYKGAESGNPTMLIWLGKQYLGQRDKQDIDQTGSLTVEIIKPERGTDDDL